MGYTTILDIVGATIIGGILLLNLLRDLMIYNLPR